MAEVAMRRFHGHVLMIPDLNPASNRRIALSSRVGANWSSSAGQRANYVLSWSVPVSDIAEVIFREA
jgi:hypothetical protein